MKTIWKYDLSPSTPIDIPKGAEVLTVQVQNGQPCLWALVDPGAIKEERLFHIYGTGHDVPESPGRYVATFQLPGLVFHVFEDMP